jgi:hypothetical protein
VGIGTAVLKESIQLIVDEFKKLHQPDRVDDAARQFFSDANRGSAAMSDDVTKKDLQYVQAVLNKKIEDVGKALAAEKQRAIADCQEVDGIVVRVRSDLEKRLDRLDGVVDKLTKAMAELAKRVAAS